MEDDRVLLFQTDQIIMNDNTTLLLQVQVLHKMIREVEVQLQNITCTLHCKNFVTLTFQLQTVSCTSHLTTKYGSVLVT